MSLEQFDAQATSEPLIDIRLVGESSVQQLIKINSKNWWDNGLCYGTDPELFYSNDELDIERAKLICQQCVVIDFCLDFALSTREKNGVWGGTSERDRRRIVRQQRIADRTSVTEVNIKPRF